MLDYYTVRSLAGNGRKISIMLAETGLEHRVHFLDLDRGDQRDSWFLAINPNGRIPVIVDHDFPGGLAIGESGAILVHLAEKTGRFLPANAAARAKTLMWTFWQVGAIGPMFGQWAYFARTAPTHMPAAIERYREECRRLLDVLDRQLRDSEYVSGEYSIADMALLPWVRPGMEAFDRDGNVADRWPSLQRWLLQLTRRPAVELAMRVPEGSAAMVGSEPGVRIPKS